MQRPTYDTYMIPGAGSKLERQLGEGGVNIHIFVFGPTIISFKMNLNEISRTDQEYMNIPPPPLQLTL